jgi:hypothetical protein
MSETRERQISKYVSFDVLPIVTMIEMEERSIFFRWLFVRKLNRRTAVLPFFSTGINIG